MYVPAHFSAPDDDAVRRLLRHAAVADLVTSTDEGLRATLLPFLHVTSDDTGHPTGWGCLVGHLARTNDQWRLATRGEAMAIVRGPDAYVSPSWYATKTEHGRVVPTWNYVTVHVYGDLVAHHDPSWLQPVVRTLTDRHERTRSHPWSLDDAPRRYVHGQLRAIVGVELRISRVEAKWKLSQNRIAQDRAGVLAGLEAGADASSRGLAAAMRELAAGPVAHDDRGPSGEETGSPACEP